MDFAFYPAQIALAVVDNLVYCFRIGHTVCDAHGGNVLAVYDLYRDELAPDTAVNLLVAFPVSSHTFFLMRFLEVVRRTQDDPDTILEFCCTG